MKEVSRIVRFSLVAVRALVLGCVLVSGLGAGISSYAAEPAMSGHEKININQADAETLASVLEGIGSSKAQAIVEWRESNGAFKSVDELTSVKGIGQATIDKNRDKLAL